jgi:hypothetical protein
VSDEIDEVIEFVLTRRQAERMFAEATGRARLARDPAREREERHEDGAVSKLRQGVSAAALSLWKKTR